MPSIPLLTGFLSWQLQLHSAFDDIALFRDMMPEMDVNVDFWTDVRNPFV